ncbi:ATP-binding cassette domain-containing protein [Caballeronia sp. dw_276]|uniref:ABC transporter ATP-binding protein n=1 Tax=Caballeronia sp. dw_276 TaxID=2719795 RepID=UPI001BD3E588|nr:ATP-binding cassette domain-containing protein [Caballeronia sp. dw_276]
MLRFENLGKRYADRIIFEGLNYRAGTGCIALNDESGSGKTTLLGILAGSILADQGDVWINGHSLRAAPALAKSAVAYIPDDCLPGSMLTGRAYLEQVAFERDTTVGHDALGLADRFGLTPHLEKRFEQMSFGTRKKICLTAAAIGDVKVVIADEPVAGLDAPARGVLVDLFRTLAETRVVLFSSYDAAFSEACGAQTITFADLRA